MQTQQKRTGASLYLEAGRIEFANSSRWRGWLTASITQAGRIHSRPLALLVLATVLCLDGWLIGLDMAFRYAVLDGTELPNWFNLSQELALGEIAEHFMLGAGSAALAILSFRRRSAIIGIVAALMLVVLFDNALQIHETCGELLGPLMPADWLLGPNQIAELAYFAIFGSTALLTIIFALRGQPSPLKAGALLVIGLLGVAAGFGIFVDALHSLYTQGETLEVVFAGLEDGGELLGMTMAGAAAIAVSLADRRRIRSVNWNA